MQENIGEMETIGEMKIIQEMKNQMREMETTWAVETKCKMKLFE